MSHGRGKSIRGEVGHGANRLGRSWGNGWGYVGVKHFLGFFLKLCLLGRKISQWFWGRGTDRSRGGCKGR